MGASCHLTNVSSLKSSDTAWMPLAVIDTVGIGPTGAIGIEERIGPETRADQVGHVL